MERAITMPKLGMTMTEGTVLHWLYQEGELVEKGEPLVEVMTDKVNMEVEAPFGGILKSIHAQDGDVLPIGAPLATLVDENENGQLPAASQSTLTPAAVQAVAQDNMIENAITSGQATPTRTPSMAVEIATQTVPSTPAAKREAAQQGISLQSVLQAGATPPLDLRDVLDFVQHTPSTSQSTQSPQALPSTPQKSVRATPVAQKMAQEHQLDLAILSEVKAGEKITRADVEAHLATTSPPAPVGARLIAPSPTSTETVGARLIAPTSPTEEDSELIPLSPIRRLIGQRMQQSVAAAPHIYLDMEIDMTEAERCRQHIGRSLQAQGEPAPSLTAIIIRAAATALVHHPEVNATLEPWDPTKGNAGKETIRRWHNVHIGFAVDTERALLTPVIRNAQQQTIPMLARELRRLTQAARQNTLKPEEMAHATFTISNLGMYGIDTFHAIIAPGQSAILAVGKVTKRGVVVEDQQGEHLEIRPLMKVSLSADHRTLDGASGSRFLHRFKTFLEDPYLLL